MIAAKQQGQEVAEAPHAKLAPVIDLMAALKKSLAEKATSAAAAKKPPVRAVPVAAQTQKKASKKSAG
jgi:non-homologous end joining protein Ku